MPQIGQFSDSSPCLLMPGPHVHEWNCKQAHASMYRESSRGSLRANGVIGSLQRGHSGRLLSGISSVNSVHDGSGQHERGFSVCIVESQLSEMSRVETLELIEMPAEILNQCVEGFLRFILTFV